jgi:hypothetical protein
MIVKPQLGKSTYKMGVFIAMLHYWRVIMVELRAKNHQPGGELLFDLCGWYYDVWL